MTLPAVPPRNSLSDELEAMAVVGHALDSLGDRAAQQRVLRWAMERMGGEGPLAPAAEAGRKDPTLDVDNLRDLFDDPPRPGLALVPKRD